MSTWIKLRDDLDTDPRVARIATHLASTATGYILTSEVRDLFGSVTKAVTRHALRDVTIAALSRVWSHANRHTQDGVFRHVTLDYLDDLARIPGFGAAMALVGWADFDAENSTVTLPNFAEHNAPDKNGQRSKTAAAIRAQRHRDKLKNGHVTRDAVRDEPRDASHSVTPPVTSQEEENNVTPSLSISLSQSISESGGEGESREETVLASSAEISRQIDALDFGPIAKKTEARLREQLGMPPVIDVPELERRVKGLRPATWGRLPMLSHEDQTAIFQHRQNLTVLEPTDWSIMRFWLKFIDSKANQQSQNPEKASSRIHHYVANLASNLDRAVTHWKQSGSPRLNPDGTKSGPKVSTNREQRTEKSEPAPLAPDSPLAHLIAEQNARKSRPNPPTATAA